MKKEMIAMLLAGGQGSRLGILTRDLAKPAVMFGGKYRIIDFPLSNCINSGVDTIGVLTQYEPLLLTKHIGIGIPWDLDKNHGGVTILSPFVKGTTGSWYSGTANAIFQQIAYIESYHPEYVLILSGDHVYKMDYSEMLEVHKEKNADLTIAVLEVPIENASEFGIMNTDDTDCIVSFEEKPKTPKSNLASMGIYIFKWEKLKKALLEDHVKHEDSDFGKHIIPYMLEQEQRVYAYRFQSYWRDIGTIEAYWKANIELTYTLPDFNLYDEFWKIYTNLEYQPPQYISRVSNVQRALISEGCEIKGFVRNSVLGPKVIVEEGATIMNSIIMKDCIIRRNAVIESSIISEGCMIGEGVKIGEGEEKVHEEKPHIYYSGITVIGAKSSIPDHVVIGKNCEVWGHTLTEHYHKRILSSGQSLIVYEGERK